MSEVQVVLREISKEDAGTLFRWRNNVEARKHFIQHHPLTWEEHLAWLAKKLGSPADSILRIAETATHEPVGSIRAESRPDGLYELSYAVAPEWQGKGIGKRMALLFVREVLPPGAHLVAKVRKGHIPSENIARALGLSSTGIEEPGPEDAPEESPIVEWR